MRSLCRGRGRAETPLPASLLALLPSLLLVVVAGASLPTAAQESAWVRPMKKGDPLIWGRRDGLVFGLASAGGIKGPRGLIRIGVYAPGSAEPQLLNFVAVEPVVAGPGRRFDRMAFSELEPSVLDAGQRGKRMWVGNLKGGDGAAEGDGDPRGTLTTIRAGKVTVERLSVRIDVERFTQNGAHVWLAASIDSDRPGELRLTPHAEADSPRIEELTLTATMGNYERLRLLWLGGRTVYSSELFSGFAGEAFVDTPDYALPEMLRTADGDAIVYCSSDESSPADSPANATAHWVYPLPKYTQFWEVPAADIEPDLRVHVNGRRVYWASTEPLPGGVAFENFEVRQRYVDGQTFVFGLTKADPWEAYTGAQTMQVNPQWLSKRPQTAPQAVTR